MRERPWCVECVEFKNLMKNSCAFFGSTFKGVLGGGECARIERIECHECSRERVHGTK